jgi:hypothetical protein
MIVTAYIDKISDSSGEINLTYTMLFSNMAASKTYPTHNSLS